MATSSFILYSKEKKELKGTQVELLRTDRPEYWRSRSPANQPTGLMYSKVI